MTTTSDAPPSLENAKDLAESTRSGAVPAASLETSQKVADGDPGIVAVGGEGEDAASRPTWNALIGTRAAEHPRLGPDLFVGKAGKVDVAELVSLAANAAFESGFGYGVWGGADHCLPFVAEVLAELGCDEREALAGLQREYKVGLSQGRSARGFFRTRRS